MITSNINLFGLKEIKNIFTKINKILDKTEIEKLKLKYNIALYNDWYKNERVKTFKTGGLNINKPFPRDKKTRDYKKYRRYPVSIGWSLGVWSGASYYALQKEASFGNIKYYKRITHSSIIIRLSGKNSNYLNLTIGMSDKLIDKYRLKLINELGGLINGIK